MKKLKSQVIEGRWSTDWWELAEGVKAVVRASPSGECSIRVSAGSPSPLHKVDSALPTHWQNSRSTSITRQIAVGAHDLTRLLHTGGTTMQADGVADWWLEVNVAAVEGTLKNLAENYLFAAAIGAGGQ